MQDLYTDGTYIKAHRSSAGTKKGLRNKKYPRSMDRWKDNWAAVSPMFKFSDIVRRVICATNAIERLNRSRNVFPDSKALLKALYLAADNITKKWTNTLRDWGQVYAELSVMYRDRLPPSLAERHKNAIIIIYCQGRRRLKICTPSDVLPINRHSPRIFSVMISASPPFSIDSRDMISPFISDIPSLFDARRV